MALWQAWNGAGFARAKRMPNLQALLRRLDRPTEGLSPKQWLAWVQQAQAYFSAAYKATMKTEAKTVKAGKVKPYKEPHG